MTMAAASIRLVDSRIKQMNPIDADSICFFLTSSSRLNAASSSFHLELF
jgi:hypothetical protein